MSLNQNFLHLSTTFENISILKYRCWKNYRTLRKGHQGQWQCCYFRITNVLFQQGNMEHQMSLGAIRKMQTISHLPNFTCNLKRPKKLHSKLMILTKQDKILSIWLKLDKNPIFSWNWSSECFKSAWRFILTWARRRLLFSCDKSLSRVANHCDIKGGTSLVSIYGSIPGERP